MGGKQKRYDLNTYFKACLALACAVRQSGHRDAIRSQLPQMKQDLDKLFADTSDPELHIPDDVFSLCYDLLIDRDDDDLWFYPKDSEGR